MEDIATVVGEQRAIDSEWVVSNPRHDLYILIEVFLEYGRSIDEIGLVVLFVDLDGEWTAQGLEGDGGSLDVGGDVSEVEVTAAFVEDYFPHVLHHGELVVVDCHRQRNRLVYAGAAA